MTSRAFSRTSILARLFGQPLAVLPATAAAVLGAIGPRLDVAQLFVADSGATFGLGELREIAAAEVARIGAASPIEMLAGKTPANRVTFVHNGVAHVPVRGELVAENDGAIRPSSGFTGYDGIRAQVEAADNDPAVRGIILDIESPGGEVADLFELGDSLMARRGTKPMRAIIRNCGASAAYTLACCADEVTLHPLGIAGSNGCITMHADYSKHLEQEGIAVTLIASGAHKADGNPFEPLPEDVRARVQTMIDTSAALLFAHVAKARGMKPEAVRDQEARVYMGEEAVAAGLVDKIMSWQDSTAEFEALVNGQGQRPAATSSAKGTSMSTEPTPPAASNQPDITQAALDTAVATARSEGATTERERLTALAELDAGTTLSAAFGEALGAGTSAGDFAIGLARAAKAQTGAALAAAKAEAVAVGKLPKTAAHAADPAAPGETNRGKAYAKQKAARAKA